MGMQREEVTAFFEDLGQNLTRHFGKLLDSFDTELKNLEVVPEPVLSKRMVRFRSEMESTFARNLDGLEIFARENIFHGEALPKESPKFAEVTPNAEQLRELISQDSRNYYEKRQKALQNELIQTIQEKQSHLVGEMYKDADIEGIREKCVVFEKSRNKMREILEMAKSKQQQMKNL
eukprot:TRINITY_DN1815_c0_g1_i1.p1 TRINITY_DN1815_c0_g1~~TRINITY_DN1815_c0_g1_i1.p1  ORF type:complete len:177 (-),score=35.61 TRINITY_DN1815_c0_g1_i1:119-649(-)